MLAWFTYKAKAVGVFFSKKNGRNALVKATMLKKFTSNSLRTLSIEILSGLVRSYGL